jgi:hypothetical protein
MASQFVSGHKPVETAKVNGALQVERALDSERALQVEHALDSERALDVSGRSLDAPVEMDRHRQRETTVASSARRLAADQ